MVFRDKAFSSIEWPTQKANHIICYLYVRHNSVEITVLCIVLCIRYWFSNDHNKHDLNFCHQPKVIILYYKFHIKIFCIVKRDSVSVL